jgi:hypothetical protein
LDTQNLSPGVIVAVVVVVAGIIGFILWRGTSAQTYTGPPINMGAAMQRAHTSPGSGAPAAPAPAGAPR